MKDAGKIGKVFTVGLGTPQSMAPYLENGSSLAAMLWDVQDLGYLTAWAGQQMARGQALGRDQRREREMRRRVRQRDARCCCSARR